MLRSMLQKWKVGLFLLIAYDDVTKKSDLNGLCVLAGAKKGRWDQTRLRRNPCFCNYRMQWLATFQSLFVQCTSSTPFPWIKRNHFRKRLSSLIFQAIKTNLFSHWLYLYVEACMRLLLFVYCFVCQKLYKSNKI